MSKCDFTLRHGCCSVNLLHIFRILFYKNATGWLLLKLKVDKITLTKTVNVKDDVCYIVQTLKQGSDIRQCPTKTKNCPTKWKTHRTFSPTGKNQDKIICPTRLCFCQTINWRYLTILLLKENKSFLINKLQYSKYTAHTLSTFSQ